MLICFQLGFILGQYSLHSKCRKVLLWRSRVWSQGPLERDPVTGISIEAMLLIATLLLLGLLWCPLILLERFAISTWAVGVLWWAFHEGFQLCRRVITWQAGFAVLQWHLLLNRSPDLQLWHRVTDVVDCSHHNVNHLVFPVHNVF